MMPTPRADPPDWPLQGRTRSWDTNLSVGDRPASLDNTQGPLHGPDSDSDPRIISWHPAMDSSKRALLPLRKVAATASD